MNVNNIIINTQSSIRLELNKIIYFDPFVIKEEKHDADIIFITHNHYDHFDIDSIRKVKNENTAIVAPVSMEAEVKEIEFSNYIFLNPYEETSIYDINIKTIPAYNIQKPFHPKENNWLGYVISYNNVSYYVAGDTDKTIDTEKVKCDVLLIPIGGKFTMNYEEAGELVRIINPKIVIPTHYGSIVGDVNDGKRLKESLSDTNIEITLKL